MREKQRKIIASSLDPYIFIPEHLFHRELEKVTPMEQAALSIMYYSGVSYDQLKVLERQNFNMDCQVPFFLSNSRVYFMKGPLLDKVKQYLATRTKPKHHLIKDYLFKDIDLAITLTTHVRRSWLFAIQQVYPEDVYVQAKL